MVKMVKKKREKIDPTDKKTEREREREEAFHHKGTKFVDHQTSLFNLLQTLTTYNS